MNFYRTKQPKQALTATFITPIAILGLALTLISCGPTRPPEPSKGHLDKVEEKQANIPATVAQTTLLPVPEARPQLETYTVVVSEVSVKDLLFSMARDAQINLDIHDDIEGTVTLNAIDQTLQQILERISQQSDIRYQIEDNTLRVRADKPFLQSYTVDYVNISRVSKGIIRVATNIGSTGSGNIGETDGGSSSSGNDNENNSSLTEVLLTSDNKFWESLTHNIIEILYDSEKENSETQTQTNTGETEQRDSSNDVIVNREAGLIMVRATYRQHKIIQSFIDTILNTSKRQVMIEATIAEIKLSDHYQAGVDWTVVAEDASSGVNVLTNLAGSNLAQPPFSQLTLNDTIGGNQVTMTLKALEQFGDVQVLSSPKVMAINNQPAILKVVDNVVYFEMNVDTSLSDTQSLTTFETEIKTVPVGFVMSVTPFINDHEEVTLNIRPTISRVIDSVEDPNPAFKDAGVISEVPIIQIREIESILTINSGDTAVIGGLMQDTVNDKDSGVPVLSSIPIIGSLFRYDDDFREKSELIIFIRPVVIHHASLTGDLSEYQKFLPEPLHAPKESPDEEDTTAKEPAE
ncbi:MAG: pilus (MSHA type) biogenesis protein MshL [endosymbiont of Galathealinum brachiosum]|uniref:Pilus (MSHA type) biogenesis protein MshL n=1 Tax=endosymbiont of Galathealinum brachiosum TaxID=2200906 RepID=A0A370DCK4_9GAMM|nr:MAG: pilus (MSHA type) biogenesis protein MshL [endosymbiont of Galathealinum brachiosum]